MPKELVIPSNIPWDHLKGADLEECLYWLLDDMGAKDIEWRKGGKGSGGNDQGRDIEAQFFFPTPDDELEPQRWWIEAKGRQDTVEPSAVKEAVVNVMSRTDIDVLVIATNTQFSNPTRNWVKDWQGKHPRPKVRLWDRNALERMIVRHPTVAVRLFSEALSVQGKLEVVRSRFWNQLHMASEGDLREIWVARTGLEFTNEALIALTVGEMAAGGINERPWMTLAAQSELPEILVVAVVNALTLCARAGRIGVTVWPIESMACYVVMTSLIRLPLETVLRLVEEAWSFLEGAEAPPAKLLELHNLMVQQILGRLNDELSDVCTQDCVRVSKSDTFMPKEQVKGFLNRFRDHHEGSSPKHEGPKTTLWIEEHDRQCNVGLALDKEHRCPFIGSENELDIRESLTVFRKILMKRLLIDENSQLE